MEYFPEWESDGSEFLIEGEDRLALCGVEIKTRVAPSSLRLELPLATAAVVRYEVGYELFCQYVPKELVSQVLHQHLVLGLRYGIDISDSEIVILYTVVF